jgi:hypothetical protein
MQLVAVLRDRLGNGKWNSAEAWIDGKLVCEVQRRRSCNGGASNLSVLSFAE